MTTVCCAIIEQDGYILIAQRGPGKERPGKWEFPGGKLENGETPSQCIKREILEELGIEIVVLKSLPPVVHDYTDRTINLIPFVCRLTEGKPIPLQHRGMAWVLPVDLPKYELSEADTKILSDISKITIQNHCG